MLQELTKALVERALAGELTHHLGYEKHSGEGKNSGNSRNGTTTKTVKGKRGEMEIEVPRDRNGEFEPQMIKKHQRRFDGFDDKIIGPLLLLATPSLPRNVLPLCLYRAPPIAALPSS